MLNTEMFVVQVRAKML